VRDWIIGQVLHFIEEGLLWKPGELDSLLDRLRTAAPGGDDFALRLANGFTPLAERRLGSPLPLRLRVDLEAVVYPRLWKIVEGMQGDVLDGELHNRVDALRRGLARVLDDEFDDLAPEAPPLRPT
jgi:hypothetical protein